MSSKFKDLITQARIKETAEDAPSNEPQALQPAPEISATSEKAPSTSRKRIKTEPNTDAKPNADVLNKEVSAELFQARRGRPQGKRSHPDFEQITAYITKSTHRDVKIALLQEGQKREFSELVEKLLSDWVKQNIPNS